MISLPNYLKNKYNHLLGVLLFLLLAYPLLREEKRLVPLIFLLALIPALASVLRRRTLVALIVGSLLVYSLFFVAQQERLAIVVYGIYALLLSTVTVLLTKDILSTATVTTDTLRGGLGIYLLLGFLWAILYILCEQLLSNAFSQRDPSLLYFSFTTLTTLGFGDITPTHEFTQTLALLEALTGQIYITVFIARLVGLQIAKAP